MLLPYDPLSAFTILVISTFALSKASCIAVDKAERISRYFGVGQFFVGMFLIAISTSLPEFSIAIISSSTGSGALSAGNVFGSSIANILFILGLGAFFFGFRADRKVLEDAAFIIVVTILLCLYIIFETQISRKSLGLFEGALLVMIFVWYVLKILFDRMVSFRKCAKPISLLPASTEISKKEAGRSLTIFLFAIAVVVASSRFVVDSALSITSMLGFEQTFIGATFLAVGTTLPELTVAFQALKKKYYGIALGDATGSIMMNITLVLGTAAMLHPISIQLKVFSVALIFSVVANLAFFYFAAVKRRFGRGEGVAMLALFALYLILITMFQLGFFGNVLNPCPPAA